MVISHDIVRLENVSHGFDGHVVLEDVNLTVSQGEVVGLIGPGGHGKSVLLKLVAGLIRPTSGKVRVFGEEVSRASDRQLAKVRAAMGYLFQNYALFDFMTVFENVAFPLRQLGQVLDAEIEERVSSLLSEVGLGAALDLYPRELSGGMKKRVGLARAVITHPRLTLYDDPSAGLDPVTSSKIFELISRMQQMEDRSAAIVVSHDVDRMKAVCERYVMLYRGRILYDGPESGIDSADPMVGDFFYGALRKAGSLS
jgi:phospholipid/cholesterol/gamma-HCH transport system ATP-binding protein